jgi:tRNA A-37 threonylcarbamoyl transferase component Bud32
MMIEQFKWMDLSLITAVPITPNPGYNVSTVFDEEGLTDSFVYHFSSGSVLADPEDTLLMVNGMFTPHLLEIRDNRSLVPLRYVSQTFGAAVDWDDNTRTATLVLDDTTVFITIGEQFAEVHKNGLSKKYDLYTPAIIINSLTYIPVRALAEILDKAVGYEEASVITYNPFVWIDEKPADWQPDIEMLRIRNQKALDSLRKNIDTVYNGYFSDWGETATNILNKIQNNIDNIKYLRHIGRYALVEGSYMMLIDQGGTVYFHKKGYLMWTIHEADFNEPEVFLGGYFLG